MEANYFTILWWSLPYIDMNQPWVYMCSPSWSPLPSPPHPIPQGHPSAPALSTLSQASNLDWQSVSHMIIYMFQCYSLKSSHPRLLPQNPKVCSLHLYLFCCLAYRVIITIFLNSTYIYVNIPYWCFSFWLTSLCITGSSFTHLIRTDSNAFFFNGWVIFHCVHVPQPSYPSVCRWTQRFIWASHVALVVRICLPMQETRETRVWFGSWLRKIPWSRKWWHTPVFLLGKYHGQRSLVATPHGGHKESDTTEWLNTHILSTRQNLFILY